MPTNPLQFKRGLDAARLQATFAAGEPMFTTDTKQLYIGDGTTVGGVAVGGGGGGGVPLITQAYAATEGYGFGDFTTATSGSANVTPVVHNYSAAAGRSGVTECFTINDTAGTFASLGGFYQTAGTLFGSGTGLWLPRNTVTAIIKLSHTPTTIANFIAGVGLTDAPDLLFMNTDDAGTLGIVVYTIGSQANWRARFTGGHPDEGTIAYRDVDLGIAKSTAWTKIEIITIRESDAEMSFTVKLNGTTVYTTSYSNLLDSLIDMWYASVVVPHVACTGTSTSTRGTRSVFVDHLSILSEVAR